MPVMNRLHAFGDLESPHPHQPGSNQSEPQQTQERGLVVTDNPYTISAAA